MEVIKIFSETLLKKLQGYEKDKFIIQSSNLTGLLYLKNLAPDYEYQAIISKESSLSYGELFDDVCLNKTIIDYDYVKEKLDEDKKVSFWTLNSKYDVDKDKKLENIPIWEFLEIITFGELVNFYDFYTKEYNLLDENRNVYILRDIVKLRNAVAHNTCVLSKLNKKDNDYPASYKIVQYLKDCNIGKVTRNNKLSNSRIRQITYTLYMFNEIVTSCGIKENVNKEINKLFFDRIILHKEYYNNNELLKSIYSYFKNIIEKNYVNVDK